MLQTHSRAREMAEGRNIFGFDITFTPARPYDTGVFNCLTTGKGLFSEANCAALRAEEIQKQTENAERKFDQNQQNLVAQINQLNTGLNNDIANESGCFLQGSDDAAFFSCAAEQIDLFRNVTQPTPRPLKHASTILRSSPVAISPWQDVICAPPGWLWSKHRPYMTIFLSEQISKNCVTPGSPAIF